jgi:hypothetical protein
MTSWFDAVLMSLIDAGDPTVLESLGDLLFVPAVILIPLGACIPIKWRSRTTCLLSGGFVVFGIIFLFGIIIWEESLFVPWPFVTVLLILCAWAALEAIVYGVFKIRQDEDAEAWLCFLGGLALLAFVVVFGPECDEEHSMRSSYAKIPEVVGGLAKEDILGVTAAVRGVTVNPLCVIEVVSPAEVDAWTVYCSWDARGQWRPAVIYTVKLEDGKWRIRGSRKGRWRG